MSCVEPFVVDSGVILPVLFFFFFYVISSSLLKSRCRPDRLPKKDDFLKEYL